MRKIIGSITNTIKNTLKADPVKNSDAASTFFKKVEAKDASRSSASQSPQQSKSQSNSTSSSSSQAHRVVDPRTFTSNIQSGKVEDRIRELDRVILTGLKKARMTARIQQIITQDRTSPLPEELRDASEIVHYSLMNDTPVRVSLVKTLLPDLDIQEHDIVDERVYEEWLKYRTDPAKGQDAQIKIDDIIGQRRADGRGKAAFEDWKINRDSKNANSGGGWKKVNKK